MTRLAAFLAAVMVMFTSTSCVTPRCQITDSPVYSISEPPILSSPGQMKHGQPVPWNPEVVPPAGANVRCS